MLYVRQVTQRRRLNPKRRDFSDAVPFRDGSLTRSGIVFEISHGRDIETAVHVENFAGYTAGQIAA